jgi:hypothetical protein
MPSSNFLFMLTYALHFNANVGVILCFFGIMPKIVESIILELDVRFLEQLVFHALEIVYSQYWL